MSFQKKKNNDDGNKKFQNEKPKMDLPTLILDFNVDRELFNETAKRYAEEISKTKKTQVRNFYEKVLELNTKVENENWENILPFVKMLNSKVAYGVTRKVVSNEFEIMMNKCIEQVKTKDDLKIFKLFFEAVLGFFKGRD